MQLESNYPTGGVLVEGSTPSEYGSNEIVLFERRRNGIFAVDGRNEDEVGRQSPGVKWLSRRGGERR